MLVRAASFLLAFLCLAAAARADVTPQAALKLPLAPRVVFLGLASAGERVIAVGERGVVMRSDDRGASWVQSDVPVRATLTAVSFVDARTGFGPPKFETTDEMSVDISVYTPQGLRKFGTR